MTGAESLVRAALASDARVCFANPGTTELPLVAALDAVPGVRPILGLAEGVCTGAADGYGRMAGKPALTLLHLGPGLANGLANLHNARRARTPLVCLVGDQPTWHVPFDPPLASDVRGLAAWTSSWVHVSSAAEDLARDLVAALEAATAPPGGVATLILPADAQWQEAGTEPAPVARPRPPAAVSDRTVARVVEVLRKAPAPALLLGGAALEERGLRAAARVAARTGARLLVETFPARLERGGDLPAIERLPYFPEPARARLAAVSDLVQVGSSDPVTFFGYPGVPSRIAPETCSCHTLAQPAEDGVAALEALAEAFPGRGDETQAPPPSPEPPSPGALDVAGLGAALAAAQPPDAIVVDEGITSSLPHFTAAAGAPRHTHLCLTGGAIGMGLPCATGAAVACPERRVIALEADGSALYTAQALWTQARENLSVTTVLCANRGYRILRVELARSGTPESGLAAHELFDLDRPRIDWVALARGFGVPATRVERAEGLTAALERSFREPGPHLIEAVLAG